MAPPLTAPSACFTGGGAPGGAAAGFWPGGGGGGCPPAVGWRKSASLNPSVADWPSLLMVTLVAPTLSDHSMLEIAYPSTAVDVVRYFNSERVIREVLRSQNRLAAAIKQQRRDCCEVGGVLRFALRYLPVHSFALQIPRSVINPVTSRLGVTSKP